MPGNPLMVYFGGKGLVTDVIWQRLGDVHNYVEPFLGSGAVLLSRPQPFHGTETVGDLDGQLVNVWRALKHNPKEVARNLMDPPSGIDMAARRTALQLDILQDLLADPEWHHPKMAAYWLYNQACWLNGVENSKTPYPTPRLWRNGMGVARYRDDGELMADLLSIRDRLRYVRIAYGDWKRTVTLSSLQSHGLSAVYLDPPYGVDNRYELYAQDSRTVSREAFQWAIENQHDPLLRVAVSGYSGEHDFPDSWQVFKWTSHGFIGKHGSQGRINRERERIWFSPVCLLPATPQQETLW